MHVIWGQIWQPPQGDVRGKRARHLMFKIDFPGTLCGGAFAILGMFFLLKLNIICLVVFFYNYTNCADCNF